jgi:methylated-DNA-[protein]-cysteine S-methyltransferase
VAMKRTRGSTALGFAERCYAVLRLVPAGRVTTYQELAHAIGSRAYRAVGSAMRKNPFAPQVPCHRVVRGDGSLGGYAKGPRAKERLLRSEGVQITNGKVVDFSAVFYRLPKLPVNSSGY